MAFTETLDCYTAAVNTPVTSSKNEFATSVNSRVTSRHFDYGKSKGGFISRLNRPSRAESVRKTSMILRGMCQEMRIVTLF